MFNPNLNLGVTYKKNVKKKTQCREGIIYCHASNSKENFSYLKWSKDSFDFLFQSLDFSSTNAGRNDKTV